MTYFNPLFGALVPGTGPQRPALDKDRQIARSQALRKNTAAEGERVEHQVESAEELPATSGDGNSSGGGKSRREGEKHEEGDDGRPHIDVTA